MATKVIVNKQGVPQVRDFIYGALTAVGTSLIPIIQAVVDSGELKFDWGKIATAALVGFFGYCLKKVADKPSVTTVYSDNQKAKSVATEIKESNEIN